LPLNFNRSRVILPPVARQLDPFTANNQYLLKEASTMPPFKISIVSLIRLLVLIPSTIAATMSAQMEANLKNPPLGPTGHPLKNGAMLRQDVDAGLAQGLVAQANQNGEVEAPVFDTNGEQTAATAQYHVEIQQVAGIDWLFLETTEKFDTMDQCNQAMRSINFFINNKGGEALSQPGGSVITKGSGDGDGSGDGSGEEDPEEGGDSSKGVDALRRSVGIQRGRYVEKSM
jgi:hypothetical protein